MGKLNVRAYGSLFRGGTGIRTAAGGVLARFFITMCTMAFLSLYTQSGYSYTLAGIGVAIVMCSNFLICPRISKLVDRYGQSKVVPWAAAAGMLATVAVMLVVHFEGPLWAAFVLSAGIGVTPQVQSLTRARWSYLFHRQGNYESGLLKTAFSFEGVLDDIAFMLAPALAIALSARLFPEAGLLLGAVAYTLGIIILLSDKHSEPDVDYMHSLASLDSGSETPTGSAFRLFPHVAVLFGGIFLLGLLFGFLDPATYAFARETAVEEVASLVFMASAIVSIATGFVFGMIYINASALKQVLFAGLAVGVLYLPMALVVNVPLLFAAHIVGAFSYAPFVITLNATVERTVPSSRVTECLTWLNAGMQLGMAIGPVAGGIIIDLLGTGAAFGACAFTGMLIPLLFAACAPILRKHLQ